jgi:hypothetical protein
MLCALPALLHPAKNNVKKRIKTAKFVAIPEKQKPNKGGTRACVLLVVDADLAGVEVADGVERLFGEVERGPAPWRRATVDDLDGDAASLARVGGGVGAAGAGHLVHPPARRAAVPQPIARRRDHRALVLEPVARRRCTTTRPTQRTSGSPDDVHK